MESNRSFMEMQKIALEFMNSLEIKPETIVIKTGNYNPTKHTYEFVKFALENKVIFYISTKTPPFECIRLLIETYLRASPIPRGIFYWNTQNGCPDYNDILKGLNIIFKGDLKGYFKTQALRNYFHVKQSDAHRVLCLVTSACDPPCQCYETGYHFIFRWEVTN